MSGHSKWSKVKHQKAVTDVAKAAAFTRASRAITIAVREGGGVTDPNFNFKLRLAIEKARAVNMPKENIERAIEKAKGTGAEELFTVAYEAIGPHNVALIIEAATDNKQRTLSLVKNTLEHNGARMVAQGAVGYMFEQKGLLEIRKTGLDSSKIMEYSIAFGADDFQENDETYEIYTPPLLTSDIRKSFEKEGIAIDTMELIEKPRMTVQVPDAGGDAFRNLLEKIEELDDVQHVFTNAE